MITTAASDPAARSCLRVSSPSMPGSHTSSRMHPYARLPSAFKHSSPLATASATKPSSSITARSVSRMPRSSSTISIESIYFRFSIADCRFTAPWAFPDLKRTSRQYTIGKWQLAIGNSSRGEFDKKLRAARMILLGADATAVLEYDLLHDRQPQTRAAVAPRKVWLKQTAKVFHFDSLPR